MSGAEIALEAGADHGQIRLRQGGVIRELNAGRIQAQHRAQTGGNGVDRGDIGRERLISAVKVTGEVVQIGDLVVGADAVGRVPGISACGPRQDGGEGGEEKVECPAEYLIVEKVCVNHWRGFETGSDRD